MNLITVWVVALVIQGTEVTQVGPYGTYGGCEGMLKSVSASIEGSFERGPSSYDGTKWGLTDNVVWADYDIQCIRVPVKEKL